jgi:voltage-gated potassium channel Kch
MVNLKRTRYTLILIVLILFVVSFILSVAAGINPETALVENSLDSLQVTYYFVNFSAASNPLFLISKILNSTIFPILTVLLASWFFDFISNFNLKERLVLSKIDKLHDHVIIVPYNSFAKVMAEDLKGIGIKSVTIAQNKKEVKQLYKENELAVEGDLRSVEIFELVKVNKARCVVACSKDDMQNALITITAKSAYPDVEVLVKANKEENLDRLDKAGALKTVLAETTAGIDVGKEIVKRLVSKRRLKNA